MRFLKCLLALLFVSCTISATAQHIRPELLQKVWNAYWIAADGASAHDYGVYQFRKTISLSQKPDSFIVHVSADNRYKLYVNEKLVSHGPARGDLMHWNFETVDLAPYLNAGINVLAAVVWNEGAQRPEAQITFQTGFILQGNSGAAEMANTNNTWKAVRDSSYAPLAPQLVYSYYVTGPGEAIDFTKQHTGWMQAAFADSAWAAAQQLRNGVPKGVFAFNEGGWMLVPRPIPQMELTLQRFKTVRKAGSLHVPTNFPAQKTSIQVPAHITATLLLDQGYLTNAYPTLVFSGGRGAQLSIAYAEALYVDEGTGTDWRAQNQKGNRNDIEGKRFVGREDRLLSNGQPGQQFTTLWWRTFRYVQLKITTGNTPLTIDDLYSHFTGYPFQLNASFKTDDSLFQTIMQIGWRTARLCAVETYMDCPYYEQLQYTGDTRIQALLSLYNSGDDRLMRNALTQMDQSRIAEGITLSRYPSANSQQIPPFSLWWIGILHDYWMYRNDVAFVQQKLNGVRQVLRFFESYQQADGSLKNTPYWNFTDWCHTKGWRSGMAPTGSDGSSAALDLQLLWAYQLATRLEEKLGMPVYATKYKIAAAKLAQTIQKKYWAGSNGMYADTKEKDTYSQHVNALAILTGVTKGSNATSLAKKLLEDTTLTQATIYFKYYNNQALVKAGLGNDYLNWLDIWKENLAHGMTTWGEMSDVNRTRSDCHAWGAHPNIEFFRVVLGIDSDAPGFQKVRIEPHLGKLKFVQGEMPHPSGNISISYQQAANGTWTAKITLPPHTPGTLYWKGKIYPLKAGQQNTLTL